LENNTSNSSITFNKEEVLNDYKIACESRHASIVGRKEVFMGKAKFGIFGDGKEIPQIAMAKQFQKGDFRSGYYRDQTFMFAIGELTLQQFFAQLYAHADLEHEPSSGGRLMNVHFGSRILDNEGKFKKLTDLKSTTSDISCTGAQMPRLVGLAYASKLYRQNPDLHQFTNFSHNGNEVAFGTIGNAATAEGVFFEAVNASGVLQIPMIISVWDDGYGISVPQEYQTTKGDISEMLEGFKRTKYETGCELYKVNGWDYPELCRVYQESVKICREEHVPIVMHVSEITQPLGHSSSGSHERYKSTKRLDWEKEYDCIKKMREWIIENNFASHDELELIDAAALEKVVQAKNEAWASFRTWVDTPHKEAVAILKEAGEALNNQKILKITDDLDKTLNPIRMDSLRAMRKAVREIRTIKHPAKTAILNWIEKINAECKLLYSSHLYSESAESALKVNIVPATYDENTPWVDGREVLGACFDKAIEQDPRVMAFGEDVGNIGDVNQAFQGLQEKHGVLRVTDTGIRETTIIGQGIGTALRGLRPIAEIQYLDYLLYAIQIMSDDLATLQYRTKGGQKAPLIIRTRGHRLEGVWHSGSPISMILGSIRGIYVLVPRNMTQAAGMYNTMLRSDDTALIIECLNGYRLKEKIPTNVGQFTVPLGIPEVIHEGKDITIVTYGSMCRIVMEAVNQLEEYGITCDIIDVQTLLPFDINHLIVESIKKTNKVIFADEDVPGGGSAYMMQHVLEEQGAYQYLDAAPRTISAKAHRPAYSSDGDYFSKPNAEDVFELVYEMIAESNPNKFPDLFK
jgi:pyruvate/2-oxoglutarate/acetoin dehydrogenase E1 component/TPP-dependent pyruvate/acetoin dehydrogenase alpha subunit